MFYLFLNLELLAVIKTLCNLPVIFNSDNKSAAQIVKESGFTKQDNCFSKDKVIEEIKKNPELIREWLMWSMDKRSSPSWFFKESGNEYIVGYYPTGPNIKYTSGVEACAEFILKEINSLTTT